MIREAERADFPAILALNAESERFLSPLDEGLLVRLHDASAYHRVVDAGGSAVAFLLVLRDGADYASPNYRWFSARHRSFLYVDRIVVGAAHRGSGLGPALYADLFAFARRHGFAIVLCEYDVDPPNERSRRFHELSGFREVGQERHNGKLVSLQEARVSERD
ncbi:MAG: GNAT family N-acetyltransferase [Candidatus Sericytochromatia bacterium]|uniref:GNAT family N-acetyltransferase n=1 Tax=Candidatus Tanganyikabacteria bacterium TaxID=2961651 RepID=A0A937X2J9_9BACT|nr:GNAT family N-acetyltransferase [Candidatus Tanganyikabacteria bacterium]